MINVVDRHYKLNRFLLLMIGLWPYQKSKFTGLQITCILGTFVIIMVFLLITIMTSKLTTDFIINILSFVCIFMSCIAKYYSFYVNSETLKNLLTGQLKYLIEQVQHFCNDLRDNNEIAIIDKYGRNAKQYTTNLIMAGIGCISLFMGAQLWSKVTNVNVDVVTSTNVSRSEHLQISTELVNQGMYFQLPLFYINAAISIGSVVILATGSMFIAYYQHACGMFRIASYRIEKAIQIYISKNKVQREILAYKSIILAVNVHRQAITFSNDVISKFEIMFIILIGSGVFSLSLNIFLIVLTKYKTEDFYVSFLFITITFVYMFIANLVGQQILDYNNHVYITTYEVKWYVTPVSVQKLLLFLLQRGSKKFGLKVGKLFIPSLESFGMLVNASVSYFTLMYSMR